MSTPAEDVIARHQTGTLSLQHLINTSPGHHSAPFEATLPGCFIYAWRKRVSRYGRCGLFAEPPVKWLARPHPGLRPEGDAESAERPSRVCCSIALNWKLVCCSLSNEAWLMLLGSDEMVKLLDSKA
jgi:hypothetical protein